MNKSLLVVSIFITTVSSAQTPAGTTYNNRTLSVNGGIKIGNTSADSVGTIRYNDGGIEAFVPTGVVSNGWKRLDNSTSFFSTPSFSRRAERNTWFTMGTYSVPDTGIYLVILKGSATNSILYSGTDTAKQDLVGNMRLVAGTTDRQLISEPYNIKISDNDARGGRYYFISIPVNGFYMGGLTGGEELKVQVRVPNENPSKTTGLTTWSTSGAIVRLIRLQ